MTPDELRAATDEEIEANLRTVISAVVPSPRAFIAGIVELAARRSRRETLELLAAELGGGS